MHVFLSWSGEVSHAVAIALREWLPLLFQSVHPWMSESDVSPGHRWSDQLSRTLEEVDFGILCMSKENLDAPWVVFEAGALSKSIERSRVIPYTFECAASDLPGPLAQFQSVPADRDGTKRLVTAIAESVPGNVRDVRTLDFLFAKLWPDLESQLASIRERYAPQRVRFGDVRILTPIEAKVLRALGNGMKPSQIAQDSGVSLSTVRAIISSIRAKLRTSSVADTLVVARRLNLLEEN